MESRKLKFLKNDCVGASREREGGGGWREKECVCVCNVVVVVVGNRRIDGGGVAMRRLFGRAVVGMMKNVMPTEAMGKQQAFAKPSPNPPCASWKRAAVVLLTSYLLPQRE